MAQEQIHDVAHLGHVELLTPKPNESLHFFKEILGMEEVARQGQSVYLRGWGDYQLYSLKLTESPQAGLGHIGMRTFSPAALERRALAIEKTGYGIGWAEQGDIDHGLTYRFTDPDGHRMEIYYEAVKYTPPAELRPSLKNQPQKNTARGANIRQLDHLNLLTSNVDADSQFMMEHVGFKMSEQLILDDGKRGAAWLHVTNKSYEIAYTSDKTGAKGRLHHLTFNVESREAVLRAADIFLDNGVYIEFAPSKHAANQTFFVYVYEPGGNRIELCAGGYLIFAPDWEPITWTQAERAKGQAWGNATVPTFHTYGTPAVE
ncbi:catechol 2,3-dioxygenase [Brevibacillus fulvus]|uniref:Catechol 2,3-dioxygenase n=1 Tax=Brevibacillus fulvus TaxID=1125967 RepID=A0A939BRZ0_9BACL|nr:catechol 2,3-dioxygenase [Brevibacillus fulvus]